MFVNFTIIFVGCLALSIKKYLIFKANQNIIQEIHIGIANPPNVNNNFNNQLYNMRMFHLCFSCSVSQNLCCSYLNLKII